MQELTQQNIQSQNPIMKFCNLVLTKKVQDFIFIVIILNALTLGMETSPFLMKHIGSFLVFADHLALAIFTVEIVLKIIALRTRFVRDPWNIFDFVIVSIAYVPAAGALTVLRGLRILRVLRLVSNLPKLRLIVQSLLLSLPSIGWISLLMLIVFYIFAVMGTMLFGSAFPDYFGSLPNSFFTLFQIMTLESWAGISREVGEVFPYANFFFIPFVLMSSFVVLNVFIAIIVNGMEEAKEEKNEEDKEEETAQLTETEELKQEISKLQEQMTRMETLLQEMNKK